jgi:hypothetical protein
MKRDEHDDDNLFQGINSNYGIDKSLEDRVVNALANQGLIKQNHRTPKLVTAIASMAAVLAFGLGFFLGGSNPEQSEYDYIFLLHETSSFNSSESRVKEYTEWTNQIRQSGIEIAGEKLGDAEQVFSNNSSNENSRITGFFLLRGDAAKVKEIAEKSPHVKYGGAIELRKIENQ